VRLANTCKELQKHRKTKLDENQSAGQDEHMYMNVELQDGDGMSAEAQMDHIRDEMGACIDAEARDEIGTCINAEARDGMGWAPKR
jgi:hypothetical protein